ncbi:hypothetical protein [Cytophaga aurantiaca]|uniref:hypothetical protein n=1 Tax=Cytophaga aurantiaca TaxID=29530 RepID=UPI00036D01E3|nr:hypothetical protein [Cytophaga aurantiaca]
MKKTLGRIALFFKRFNFLFRLIPVVAVFYFIYGIAIPDIKFNLTGGKAVEMTFEELMNAPVDQIPRYVKITDAVVPSASYAEFRNSKSNSLSSIYYPVYSSKDVKLDIKELKDAMHSGNVQVVADSTGKISVLKNTDAIVSKVIIHDPYVKESELDSTGGKYFNNPNFTIEGQYSDEKVSTEVLNLLTEAGINVSPDAIVLNKGYTPSKTINALIAVCIGTIIIALVCLSCLPEKTLQTWIV